MNHLLVCFKSFFQQDTLSNDEIKIKLTLNEDIQTKQLLRYKMKDNNSTSFLKENKNNL